MEALKAAHAAELAASQSDSAVTRENIGKLTEEIATLRAALKKATEEARRELDGNENVIKLLQDEVSNSVHPQVQEMKEQMESLKAEYEEQIQKLIEEHNKDSEEHEAEIEKANKEQLDSLKVSYEEKVAELENRIAQVKKEGEEEAAKVAEQHETERRQIEQGLSEEKAKGEEALQQAENSAAELKKSLEEAQNMLQTLDERLRREQHAHEVRAKEFEESIRDLEEKNAQAIETIKSQFGEEKTELLDQVNNLDVQLRDAEAAQELRIQLEAEKAQLTEALASIEAKLQQVILEKDRELQAAREEADARVADLEASLEDAKEKITVYSTLSSRYVYGLTIRYYRPRKQRSKNFRRRYRRLRYRAKM